MKAMCACKCSYLVLLCVLLVAPCAAVLSKTIVASCCNDDSTYSSQEAWASQKLYVVGYYSEFCQSSFYNYVFGSALSEWNAGRVVHLTLSAQTSAGCSPTNFVPADPNNYIITGGYDTYIGYFVQNLTIFLKGPDGILGSSDDRRIYLRLAHELNGNWYAWSANSTSYQMMWRYVWNKVMVGTGIMATHIQWVFEPISPWEVDAQHDFRLYWPGDQYVDWLSLDAYNVGGLQPWYQPWEIFDSMLYKLRDWRPALPVAISETGCYSKTTGGVAAKAAWLTALYPYLAGWNVQLVVYFNTNDGSDDWPYFWTTGNAGQQNISESGTTYTVYPTWKTAIDSIAYELTSPTSPRIMTDDEFQGRLPGYQTKPAQPRNLMIYDNGANYYDWQCTNAGASIISLQDTTQHPSGETYSMSVTMNSWGSLQLHHAHMGANSSNYNSIQFSIFAVQSSVVLHLTAYSDSGAQWTTYTVPSPTVNTWTTYTVTWSQLGVPAGTLILGFYVQSASNSNQGTVYYAGVQLLSNPPTWPAGWPTSTTTAPTTAPTTKPSTPAPSTAAPTTKAATASPAPTAKPSWTTSFASKSNVETLSQNAAISNGLTLQVTDSSGTYTGGSWTQTQGFSYGNFTFVVKSTAASGTALLLWGQSTSGTYSGFQIGLQGNSGSSVAFQTFGAGAFSYTQYSLSFNPTAAYNTYTIIYGSTFKLYVNNVLIVTTSGAPTVPLQMSIQLVENAQYYGAISGSQTFPVSYYANYASWVSA